MDAITGLVVFVCAFSAGWLYHRAFAAHKEYERMRTVVSGPIDCSEHPELCHNFAVQETWHEYDEENDIIHTYHFTDARQVQHRE